MKDLIGLYNKKRSVFASKSPCAVHIPLKGALSVQKPVESIAVVIPACNEYPLILNTFDSIKKSAQFCTIICVVNNRVSAVDEVKENNRLLIRAALDKGVLVLDAASHGFELPENEGVGLARRIGMDYALKNGAQVIACMDADTLVCSSYMPALQEFGLRCACALALGKNPSAGAVTDFSHQKTDQGDLQKAIDAYEFFIKEHSARLFKTKTPFYPYALGPAILCSAWGYAAAGGMPKRMAGEDFYFLQSLVKLHIQHSKTSASGNKVPLMFPRLDCTVFPQARLSQRTLFGTGQKLGKLIQSQTAINKKESLLYPDFVYRGIEDFIDLFYRIKDKPEYFLRQCRRTLPEVYAFLDREGFPAVWEKILLQNGRKADRLEKAFHVWFDGLKILRLIHCLTR